jgi:tRNA(Ile)-lysidine synthase
VALHVHHGIQAAADGFVGHCTRVCAGLGVPLRVAHVDGRHAPGDSPEDAARKARYTALADLAQQAGIHDVLLGQHADDQIETLLLALSRGAGLPGLAAMPARFVRHGTVFHRPLLEVSAAEIRSTLAAQGVAFITDPSNADTILTRNRIRLQLLPALEAAFPQFRSTFGRSIRHVAQAQDLLQALAEDDLARVGNPPAITALQQMPRARQANVLRHWLKTAHGAMPSAAQLEELLGQIAACTTRGHALRIKVGSGFAERRGAHLAWYNP